MSRVWKTIGVVFLCLLLLLTVAGYTLLYRPLAEIRNKYETAAAEDRANIAKHRSAFLEDHVFAYATGLYPSPTARETSKDAGPLLNPALSWSSVPDNAKPWPRATLLSLPKHVEEVVSDGDKWLADQTLAAEAAKLDYSWMEKLFDYEYWSLDLASPVAAIVADLDQHDPQTLGPTPNGISLLNWARLRLLQTVHGQMGSPARVLRQMVRLLNTTEDLVSMAIATAILDVAREAYEAMKKHNAPLPQDWQPYSKQDIQRLRRVVFASGTLINPSSHPEGMKLLKQMKIGECAALVWAANAMHASYRPILQHEVPSFFRDIDQALAEQKHCRMTLERAVWSNREYLKRKLSGQNVFAFHEVPAFAQVDIVHNTLLKDIYNVAKHPWLSRQISMILLSTEGPNTFGRYENADKK